MAKALLAMVLAAFAFVACTNVKKAEESADAAETKILVLYYSQNGTTAKVAEEIKNQLGADIEALEAETPYDGDFQATIERCQKEKEAGEQVKLKPVKANIDDYDVIFVGYPIWFGSYAQPIAALVSQQSFEGKKVVPFCTFGSGGLVESTEALRAALPKAEVLDGYGVRSARMDAMPEEVSRFLIESGYKEGDVEALPGFMEQRPVTDEEKAVFDEACSDYEYPLGTPEMVAVRETSTSTDYQFVAKSAGKDGEESTSTIYVTKAKKDGAKAVFTRVDRI